jgi:hypothetical protein
MFEPGADGSDSSDYFLFGCSNRPPIDSGRRLNCVRLGVQIDGGEDCVNKSAEASPARPVDIAALDEPDSDRRESSQSLRCFRVSKRGDGLCGDRRLRCTLE